MSATKKVLVPIDFSEPSDVALVYGRNLAKVFGAELHVLHVMENRFLRATFKSTTAIEISMANRVAERLSPEDRTTLHAVSAVRVSDDPYHEIIEYAEDEDIDLIVMGTHGRSGVDRLLMGSVAEKVVRTARCPVLTVRHHAREFVSPDRTEAAMIALKRILVATDFSEAADAALAYGRALARLSGATLHVLHVTDDVYVRIGGDAYAAVLPELQQDVEKQARERLARLLIDNDPNPLSTVPVVITTDATARAIVDYAARADIDLIVVGTHGRGAVAHFIMGSIAERVVRTARCPVLTVRDHERDFVTPDVPVAAARA